MSPSKFIALLLTLALATSACANDIIILKKSESVAYTSYFEDVPGANPVGYPIYSFKDVHNSYLIIDLTEQSYVEIRYGNESSYYDSPPVKFLDLIFANYASDYEWSEPIEGYYLGYNFAVYSQPLKAPGTYLWSDIRGYADAGINEDNDGSYNNSYHETKEGIGSLLKLSATRTIANVPRIIKGKGSDMSKDHSTYIYEDELGNTILGTSRSVYKSNATTKITLDTALTSKANLGPHLIVPLNGGGSVPLFNSTLTYGTRLVYDALYKLGHREDPPVP